MRGKPSRPRRLALAAIAVAGLVALAVVALPQPDGKAQPNAEDPAYANGFVHRFQKAQRLFGAGRDAECDAILRELVAEQPEAAAVHHAIAHLAWQRGRGAEAIESFVEAARLAPKDGAIRRDAGFHLIDFGRAKDGLEQLAAARLLVDPDVEIEVYSARALQSLDRVKEAEDALRRGVAIDGNSVDARTGLAALIVARDPAEALTLTQPIPENWPDVVLVRAFAFERLGKTAEAKERCLKVAKLAPPDGRGVPLLRDAAECLARLGDPAGAGEVADRWALAEKASGGASPRAAFTLAVCRAALGDAKAGLAALDAAPLPEKSPEPIVGLAGLLRAHLLLASGDAAGARAALEPLAALTRAPFERAAARRILGSCDAAEVAAAAAKEPGRANDAAWVEGLAAWVTGDAAGARERFAEAAKLSAPAGEHPGLLVRCAPALGK